MANPRLRILLVDDDHFKRMSIEKNFSALGYHRVAPLSSMRELLTVIENSLRDFDLLVINESILSGAGVVLEQMVRSCSHIKHLLVYQGDDLPLSSSIGARASISFFLPGSPSREAIRQVMSVVDEADIRLFFEKGQLPNQA